MSDAPLGFTVRTNPTPATHKGNTKRYSDPSKGTSLFARKSGMWCATTCRAMGAMRKHAKAQRFYDGTLLHSHWGNHRSEGCRTQEAMTPVTGAAGRWRVRTPPRFGALTVSPSRAPSRTGNDTVT